MDPKTALEIVRMTSVLHHRSPTTGHKVLSAKKYERYYCASSASDWIEHCLSRERKHLDHSGLVWQVFVSILVWVLREWRWSLVVPLEVRTGLKKAVVCRFITSPRNCKSLSVEKNGYLQSRAGVWVRRLTFGFGACILLVERRVMIHFHLRTCRLNLVSPQI